MKHGELIRFERSERGLTLKQLGELSGVNYSRISRIENGDGASDEVWKALAAALDLEYTPARLTRRANGSQRSS